MKATESFNKNDMPKVCNVKERKNKHEKLFLHIKINELFKKSHEKSVN